MVNIKIRLNLGLLDLSLCLFVSFYENSILEKNRKVMSEKSEKCKIECENSKQETRDK